MQGVQLDSFFINSSFFSNSPLKSQLKIRPQYMFIFTVKNQVSNATLLGIIYDWENRYYSGEISELKSNLNLIYSDCIYNIINPE